MSYFVENCDVAVIGAGHAGIEAALAAARLKLADCTRVVLRNGLRLIGVEAPEKM